jgi:hypothetical protein
MKRLTLVLAVAAALAGAACIDFTHSTTTPSSNLQELAGTWASSNIIPDPNSCTDFKWNVTEYTGSTAAGTFSGTCANGLHLEGTARGSLSGNLVNWTANGTASASNLASCPFSLTGTATLNGDTITVPYSGTTCLGAVSGTEVLKKH